MHDSQPTRPLGLLGGRPHPHSHSGSPFPSLPAQYPHTHFRPLPAPPPPPRSFYPPVYRLVTSVVIHGGLLHVAFNMLAFVPMGAALERLVGTVQASAFVPGGCRVAPGR